MLTRLRNWAVPPAIEQREIVLAGRQIPYTLKRSARRRSIGLRIDDRGLTVSMPLRASERWLGDVLRGKAQWVVEKLEVWRQRVPATVRYAEGAPIPFLGEPLTLKIRSGLFEMEPQRESQSLWIFVRGIAEPHAVERQLMRWYRAQAELLFAGRVAYYAAQMNLQPRAVRLSNAKTQWGSCSARGIIRLNHGLIRLPLDLVDYVVVHELAHLREMNHSAVFWQVVADVCPEYQRLRRELGAFTPG
ncbi:MAG: SprT family zinc-dependent metalloprotease [Gallionella sp.]|nr:SprT family zinc-dependent metalloprotease [Gallionella sp.]